MVYFRLIIFAFLFILIHKVGAQGTIPLEIKQSVLTTYPTKNPIKSYEMPDKNWYLEFVYEYKLYQVIYDTKSNKITKSILEDTLPNAIINTLSTKYANKLIVEFSRKNRNDKTFFKIELRDKSSEKKIELVLDEDGKILEKE